MKENLDVVLEEENSQQSIPAAIREWAARVEIPEDHLSGESTYETSPIELQFDFPAPRTYEQRQADRLANIFKRRHFEHMTTHGMSSMPRHVRLRAVRGGCFVDVFYTYAFIQMPFNSIRLARKYVKYMGLPLHCGEEK